MWWFIRLSCELFKQVTWLVKKIIKLKLHIDGFFNHHIMGWRKIDTSQFVAKLVPITVVQLQTLSSCEVSLNKPILIVQFSLMYTNSKLPRTCHHPKTDSNYGCMGISSARKIEWFVIESLNNL